MENGYKTGWQAKSSWVRGMNQGIVHDREGSNLCDLSGTEFSKK